MTTPEEKLEQAISESAAALKDGLDLSDIPTLIRNGIEVADTFDDLDGPAKLEIAERYVSELIGLALDDSDQLAKLIAAIDIPYVPEGVEAALIDPLIQKALPPVLRPLLLSMVPGVVKVIVDASRGEVDVNAELWAKLRAVATLLDHVPLILQALSFMRAGVDEKILSGEGTPSSTELDAATLAISQFLPSPFLPPSTTTETPS